MASSPSRLLRISASGVAAALLAIALPATAQAAPPASGPTSGGTVIGGALPGTHYVQDLFTQVDANAYYSVAIGVDGIVYGWGLQPAWGTGIALPAPVQGLPTDGSIVKVSAGYGHSLALRSDGTVWAWGENGFGQLGRGNTATPDYSTAQQVTAGSTLFSDISAGDRVSMAIDRTGKAWAWGNNFQGGLGVGSATTPVLQPTRVALPSGATLTAIHSGLNTTASAVDSLGRLWVWGFNNSGQVGNGAVSGTNVSTPVQITGGAASGVEFSAIGWNMGTTIVLGSNGKAYAWGSGSGGQLGDGGQANSPLPVEVSMPPGVSFTAISGRFAKGSDGRLWTWGTNITGSLGVGLDPEELEYSLELVPVQAPEGVEFASFSSRGFLHGLALDADGRLYAWGDNGEEGKTLITGSGQLGTADGLNRTRPVPVGNAVVAEVRFGGVAGANLTQDASGWSADSPEHACGVVDVEVDYLQFGERRTQTLPGGFTYTAAAPTIAQQPQGGAVAAGGTFSATAASHHDARCATTVQWQRLVDAGADTWEDVPGATSTTLALRVSETTTFRAEFADALGRTVRSDAAVASVEPAKTPARHDSAHDEAALERTGAEPDGRAAILASIAGALGLAGAVMLLTAARRRALGSRR